MLVAMLFGTLLFAPGQPFEATPVGEKLANTPVGSELFDSFPLLLALWSRGNVFGKSRPAMMIADIARQKFSLLQPHQEPFRQSLASCGMFLWLFHLSAAS